MGVAWLGAQTLGAIASLPAYAHIREPMILSALSVETGPHPGIAQLIELSELQSQNRLSGPYTRDFYMDSTQYR